ncbi:oxoglutarate dehydrogenase [Cavenderia fasciculata]|uniref:Oxoglutarate dehydrogenase n=1 Tax=Cavenderia fasciculata TaxID=261658 RepID=F4Q063_CACFS|nr:oxoglutarate dehydrogenase [Cavenderia fasciculata]EGG18743.1 oxoglutarate dehydrogenase [Cavenderia fasciculata]|eukprot:XP_004357205.1 oxoglutarate dehydrogenase [Cavenderia fasciculata]
MLSRSISSTISSRAMLLTRNASVLVNNKSYSSQSTVVAATKLFVNGYRANGHLKANIDPLARMERLTPKSLSASTYGLETADKLTVKGVLNALDNKDMTVTEIQQYLERVYCGDMTVQFEHIESEDEKLWLYNQFEQLQQQDFTTQEKVNILKQLVKSEVFDHFMQKKFTTTKRYGLEGNESMMVACESIFRESSNSGIENIVIGMPHRGRLNLLVKTLNYPAVDLFWKVKGNSELAPGIEGIGDVISHIGVSSTLSYPKGSVNVSLIHNPSHLEAADPVALGKTRAKQMYDNDIEQKDRSMCLMMHGDAAVTGQGVVTESLQLSQLPGFNVGGCVHIIVNNQLGFTTIPKNGRSTRYSSDVGKFVGCPIIIVNSQNPEMVERAARLAIQYRQQFKKDIIIDLIGWRKYGHNEIDEPSFTQPTMYNNIRKRTSIPQMYAQQLQQQGVFSAEQLDSFTKAEHSLLEKDFEQLANFSHKPADHLQGKWEGLIQSVKIQNPSTIDTGYNKSKLVDILKQSVQVPEDFTVHNRLVKSFSNVRVERAQESQVDWASAETAAVGSLMQQGFNVRISGQDVGRGTFSQRHWELVEQKSDKVYSPLNHMNLEGQLDIVNSNLSEFAVMGYEYGYSIESPKTLPIWEAQFGDFVNGAQIIVDQFLSNGESKWLRQSALTLLLPHGFDGAGPEHSSCKMERFLQLCDTEAVNVKDDKLISRETNIRQMMRNYRKPLVVVGPKVLLRHPQCVSSLDEMSEGTHFQPVLSDAETVAPEIASKVERVIFCSGKIYYDLVEERKKHSLSTAIVRLEELNPFPYGEIEQQLNRYGNATKFYWVQEEQQNAGAWSFVEPRFKQRWSRTSSIKYIGRDPLCASAIGISTIHKKEATKLISTTTIKTLLFMMEQYSHTKYSNIKNEQPLEKIYINYPFSTSIPHKLVGLIEQEQYQQQLDKLIKCHKMIRKYMTLSFIIALLPFITSLLMVIIGAKTFSWRMAGYSILALTLLVLVSFWSIFLRIVNNHLYDSLNNNQQFKSSGIIFDYQFNSNFSSLCLIVILLSHHQP